MDFFHCNSCYIQPGPPENKTFLLTNCGHSFCCDCANTIESKCKVCLNDCKYLAVNSDMPEDLRPLFSDPIKELKKAVKILLIQNKHCKIYMEEYVPKLESKYVQAKMVIENNKSYIDNSKKVLENKDAEIQSLRVQNARLKTELEEERKKSTSLHQQPKGNYSPASLSSPSSFGSVQEGFFTPKSYLDGNKGQGSLSFNFMNRQNKTGFHSHLTPSPPSQEKRKLTAMELLFKNKEAAVRNSQCERTPRTPVMRSNQTFNMSINVTPPDICSSDDSQEAFSDAKSMPSPLEVKMRHFQRQSSEINNYQRRNAGMIPSMSSPASFKSRNFQRPSSEMGRKFFHL